MTDKFSRPSHTPKADSGPQTRVRRFAFVLLAVLVLSCIVFSAASAAPELQTATPTAPNHIVISEFRFDGSNGAGDDFVEVFNPTGGTVDISGWKIRGSNNAGAVSNRYTFPANTVIQPGQHYLITGSSYDDGVTSDGVLSTGITIDGGVAITLADNTVIDAVGLSTAAASAFSSGVLLTALIGGTDQSYERLLGDISGSCYDNDTSSDFAAIATALPQNLASPLTYCAGVPTFTPTSATQTLTVTPPLTATETPIVLTSTVTLTPTISITPTITPTGPTSTITPTIETLTPTQTGLPTLQLVVINEVAWAGTEASASDEWIEFYNPGPLPVNLNGWVLNIVTSGSPTITIPLSNTILPSGPLGYYLLENDETTTNVPSDQTSASINLSNSGSILFLYDSFGRQISTANFNGGAWPAGKSTPRCSMERALATAPDVDSGWFTNNNIVRNGLDANGDPICGTPKNLNWSYSVTVTPSLTPTITPTLTKTRTPTLTRTRTRTPTSTTAPLVVSSVVINEFLVKPRADYNQDGKIDSNDAFIEIKNLSTISVSVGGYYLDDQAGDSSPYYLPSLSMAPGARQVYFASETGIILSEAVDSVRLFKSSSFISDVYTYTGGVKVQNQSWCRYPDGGTKWTFGCEPTPGEENRLAQIVIIDDDTGESELTLCLSQVIPALVREAECLAPGLSVWSPIYWIAELQREYPLYLPRDSQYDILE